MSIELIQAAQQAVDAFKAFSYADDFASLFELTQKMRALRTAIQQPATGEPVAWLYVEDGEVMFGHPSGYRPADARPLVFGDTPPAPSVPDEREAFESCALMEGSLFKRRADDPDKYWDGNVQDDWELWQARAILSLRPERVPMTDTQLCEALNIDGSDDWTYQVRDAVEAHHGITAQAKKETP